MTIGKAKKFIDRGLVDGQLRDQCMAAQSLDELNTVLSDNDLSFSYGEFEDAYNNKLTSCQFEDQANQLKEFKQWWDLLHAFFGSESAPSQSKCATSSTCMASGACSSCQH